MAPNRYYALTYLTRTGLVLGELPLAADPSWTQMINNAGSWTVQVPVGGTGISRDKFLEWVEQEWKISVAICYGTGSANDLIVQGGPIVAWNAVSESPPVAQIGGQGMWGMLNRRGQFQAGWNGASVALGAGADTSYGPTSLQGVAVGIINNAVSRDALPIDVPAAITGTVTMPYFGYDFAVAGQRLTELATTITGGPDILFAPYFSNTNTVRHQALIGNPGLTSPSTALYFDYPGNISSILPSRDASKMSTVFYVKGNGMEYASIFGSFTDTFLTNQGWPLLDNMNTSQSSVVLPSQLASIAQSDDALYGRSLETWVARVRMELNPVFGSYSPGVTAVYNVIDHPFKRDGQYTQRIVGFQVSQGDPVGEVQHLLQSTQGET